MGKKKKKNKKKSREKVVFSNYNKHGTIVSFTEDDLLRVEQLAMMGATNKDLAYFFNVHEKTIESWVKKYPEFGDARKRGGMYADMQVAQNCIYRRAMGFYFKETKIFKVGDRLEKIKINTYIPPDVKAGMFWLSNRQRQQWSGATSKVTHEGTVKHQHTPIDDLDVNKLDKPTQDMLFEVVQQQLEEGGRDN